MTSKRMKVKSLGIKSILAACVLVLGIGTAAAQDNNRNRNGHRDNYQRQTEHAGDQYRQQAKRDRQRQHAKRDRQRQSRRRDNQWSIDLGGVTLFFGGGQGQYNNRSFDRGRHSGRGKWNRGHDQGYKQSKHRRQQQVAQACQRVTKIGYWHGRRAIVGGRGCQDRYGNFYMVPQSRYLIRYAGRHDRD